MGQLKNIVYNCKQATYLIEKKLVGRITFRQEVELRIHLYGCSVCGLFSKQSQMINTMVKQLLQTANNPDIKLDDDFKRNLEMRIEDELNKN